MAVLGGILAILLALAGLFGCGALTAFQDSGQMPSVPNFEPAQPVVPSAPEATFRSDVVVTDVVARVLESDPAQIELDVTGYNPDGCEYPVITEVMQGGSTVSVYLYRDLPVAATCPAVVVDYQSTISLGTLESGIYSISVNGYVVEVEV